MASQFPSYAQEGSNSSGPSNTVPSESWSAYASSSHPYLRSEFQNMFSMSLPGGGPFGMMNGPIVNQFTPSFPYLTGSASESDPVGNDGIVSTFSFPPYLQPHEYYEWQTMGPLYHMQSPSCTTGPSYSDSDNRREIPIAVVAGPQEVVPVSSANSYIPSPPTYSPSGLPGPIAGAQDSTRYAPTASRSESTGDAPDSASSTSLPIPHIQTTPSSGSYQTFIDDRPVLNRLYNLARDRVASHPIVMASLARRRNPAPFTCDYCRATFTRSHNLGYHVDAHFGRKNHSSLCGRKFVTPAGSKRHQNTCSKCLGVSGSTPSLG